MRIHSIFTFLFLVVCVSCKKKNTTNTQTLSVDKPPITLADSCTTTISFQQDIMPIFSYYCTSCHDTKHHIANLDLTSFDSISKYASVSLKTIQDGSMPPSGILSNEMIQKITCWIKQGKKYN